MVRLKANLTGMFDTKIPNFNSIMVRLKVDQPIKQRRKIH